MRILTTWLLVIAATIFHGADGRAQRATLATYHLGQGWATFGLVLPRGVARGGVDVGDLQTQTDVKTTWEDGSIRFAAVTAQVTRAGVYPIHASGPTTRAAKPPVWPTASVEFVIDGAKYLAPSPKTPTTDVWLSGSEVHEARALVTPMTAGTPHPFLRVRYDVRTYSSGGQRLSVTVESIVDVPELRQAKYAVTMTAAGAVLYTNPAVIQPSFTRWRKVFLLGRLQEAEVVPDFTPFHQAKAIPEYLATAADPKPDSSGPKFDILKIGDMTYPMAAAGGRPEFGPYPAWVAHYVAHKQPSQLAYLLKNGENVSGAWSVHITNPDDTPITVDQSPNWTWAAATPGPVNKKVGRTYDAEIGAAHQPSFAYVPYLITGDRFYLDEMKHWAHYTLTSYLAGRQGATGLIVVQQVRGAAWGLRDLSDAAAYAPDDDRYKPYFISKLKNSLRFLDARAQSDTLDPLGSIYRISGYVPGSKVQSQVPQWQNNYLSWALHHVIGHGFGPDGSIMRDRIVNYQIKLLTSGPNFNPLDGARYWYHVVRNEDGTPFTSFGEMWQYNFGGATPRLKPATSLFPTYGLDARLAILVALELRLPGAQQAYDFIMEQSHAGNARALAVDILRDRSEFALKPASGMTQPPSPADIRIVR